jgi:CHAT domain-containing protein
MLEGPDASLLIAELRNCHALHLACCGLADASDPSNSHLRLKKGGNKTPKVDKLHVRDISGMNYRGAVDTELAYLSACPTASNLN